MSTVEVRSNRMELLAMIWFYCCVVLKTSSATDTMFPNQPLKDGDTLVSEAEIFELAFFGLGNSTSRYLGIRYKHVPDSTIVWVANREVPLADRIGVLKINDRGTLQLLNLRNTSIWSSKSSKPGTNMNPVAQLLDSGNLVIRDDISGDLIWQSFDHPGDTWLPGMKIGVDRVMGTKRRLTSWKTSDDPSSGSYSVWMDNIGYPQLYTAEDGSNMQPQRVGYWNGLGFTGLHGLERNIFYAFDFVSTDEENYYNFTLLDSSYLTRVRLDQQGNVLQFVWDKTDEKWRVYMELFVDACDRYAVCGSYGSCNINNAPACACLQGFEPKLPMEWSIADWSNGCKHKISATDENGENFRKFTNLKLPDSRYSWFDTTISLEECGKLCARNGYCTAYANIDVRGSGSGCLQWSGELFDIRDAPEGDVSGQDIYIKMSNTNNLIPDKKKKSNTNLKVTMSIVFAVALLGFALILYAWRKLKKSHANKNKKQDSDLPLFSLSKIIKATSNFSIHNKLGQGGFGAVYKGVLDEGGEIAVKRLSKTSKQGLVEFQNEVKCIAKLQHRNLVKLLGYCIQGEEMMLIYEYMSNKSLDSFLFDENNSLLLNWRQRYHIINGIARGLLYLHQDSRLRIIHRDLKASNILLDSNMNPKISDFGLARMFKEYETEANTNKVVGTLGYISPEYAANGLFSVKSDVFSFGVLVLEIVSGKKNRGFSHQDHHDNLLGHAWRLYKEDKPLELVDTALGDSWVVSEVLQSIHVGLSCVQQHADDRPIMSSVIHMLSGEGALPPPQPPGFFTQVPNPEVKSNLIMPEVLVSVNEVTITQFDAR
ncbi:G-type lectin S-receptor-like serine/threonine-protein kinase At4g27290 isoform X1 [Lactuca sativa]|uniref:G-type lectin S-receptor-like serine/threonine-protein kinase At4g27290 isoform X1 n=1 Tax=Lactuca sativa TaxID=4236 RepID=UPI000CD9DC08|nr:G-type lectin S-receptor-like serine/threonine-protein kinase At4g27290 isoform X1 [Lactuca sativa]XP_023757761.1 G-type lectin S-receptor-like serine/threonine-protein kinase At4g27290 isoform X1 [Lactuca sativa]XP_023757762.1 G-type lectin S-receptor-like serine/threonine-protein kinase At4g27290 isoform X1 [Lactuca sativa]XP_023757766.1 G-type lectin S-receptor-like serine/threonine-protein kinase At4g27290 isoform X1 [Lactuca sativa]XP_042755451.1 G-type lectin S-receptor-like serine/thr